MGCRQFSQMAQKVFLCWR